MDAVVFALLCRGRVTRAESVAVVFLAGMTVRPDYKAARLHLYEKMFYLIHQKYS